MSEYGRELHKYVMGETRVDGFKSDWRLEQERRRAEDATKPRPIVRAVARQEKKKYPNRHPNAYYFKRECSVCAFPIRQSNITGRCIKHKLHVVKERPCAKCPCCGTQLNKQNAYGLCKVHYTRFRRLIHREANRCFCGKPIRKDSRWDKCRVHSKKERSAYEYQIRKAA